MTERLWTCPAGRHTIVAGRRGFLPTKCKLCWADDAPRRREQHRQRLAAANTGRKYPPSHGASISAAHLKKPCRYCGAADSTGREREHTALCRPAIKLARSDREFPVVEWLTLWAAKTWFICVYCGRNPGFTLDHVVPRVEGGQSTLENVVPCCHNCNTVKHVKSLEQFQQTPYWRDWCAETTMIGYNAPL